MTTTIGNDVYYDPYDPTIRADPYPVFRRLRDEAPLYVNEAHGFYAVSRFEDVQRTLKDRTAFSNEHGTHLAMIKAGLVVPPVTLIGEQPPSHTIHRQLLSRIFTPRAMLAIEPDVRAFCARRLDELMGESSFDFVDDFARYVPMRVFGMLLGISEADQERVVDHVEINHGQSPDQPKSYEDGFPTGEFYGEFLDYRRDHPGDDVITRLLTAEFDDEEGVRRTLTRQETLVFLNILASAGNHTTSRLIGWSAKVLADNADARRELVLDPTLVPAAIEETLRYEPSSQWIGRYVAQDVELHGTTVPAGSAMLCLVGAANRDERMFDDPDTFDIHRQAGQHLTFGHGTHFCLGASLARLEGRVALEEMLARFPEWEVDLDNAEHGTAHGVRGFAHLPITVHTS